jgi:phage gp29-like protein
MVAKNQSFNEIGISGLNTSGGAIYEEFLTKLQWPRAGKVYQEMASNDPIITAILLAAKQLIKNVKWTVEPFDETPQQQEKAAFVETCMDDMSQTWADTLDEILSYFEYGFSYHEIVYKKRMGINKDASKNSRYSDGKIGWRKLAGRAQTSLHSWQFEPDGSLLGMNQSTDSGISFIPIEKSLLFRTTSQKNNPEGRSMIRGAYRSWYFKKHIEEIEGIGIERDLAGLPVLQSPEGLEIFAKDNPDAVEQRETALRLIASIRRDQNEGVLLPFGWDLKLLASGSSRQFNTTEIITRYDQRIATTILADIVMIGSNSVGSFALAKVKQSLLAASLDAQLKDIADVFNRYAIPRLFAVNGDVDMETLPKLVPGDIITPELGDIGNFLKAMTASKFDLSNDLVLENYLREQADLPLLSEEQYEERYEKQLERKRAEEEAKSSSSESDPSTEYDPNDPDNRNGKPDPDGDYGVDPNIDEPLEGAEDGTE